MSTPKAILLSGLIAALAIVALAFAFSRQNPVPAVQPIVEESAPEPQIVPLPPPKPITKTYTNAKYGFSVEYPETLVLTEDAREMQLSGYIPVCDPDHAIVCFPIAKNAYENTNFGGAAFAVHSRGDLKKPTTCGAPSNGEMPDGEANLNGVTYKKFSFSDAAMSHRLEGENYRVYKNGRCFELSTRVTTTVYEVYEPGTVTRFSEDDRSSVQAALDLMLTSFRFVSGS